MRAASETLLQHVPLKEVSDLVSVADHHITEGEYLVTASRIPLLQKAAAAFSEEGFGNTTVNPILRLRTIGREDIPEIAVIRRDGDGPWGFIDTAAYVAQNHATQLEGQLPPEQIDKETGTVIFSHVASYRERTLSHTA